MKVRQVIFLVACFFAFQAWASATEQGKVSTVLTKAAIESPINPSDWKKQPEAIALEEQNKIIKQYHSALTDTVYFALSLVGGVAALLVGASFLINFKLYESDKERISEKMAALKSELDSLRKSQLDAVVSLRAELEANTFAQTEKAKTESLISVQTQLAGYADRASNEMVSFRSELAAVVERNENRYESVQTKLEKLLAADANLLKKIAAVEAIAREAEAEAYDIRNYRGAKLIKLSQALRAAAQAEQVWNVKSLFEQIAETLRHVLDVKSEVLSEQTIDFVKKAATATEALDSEGGAKVLTLLAQVESSKNTPST